MPKVIRYDVPNLYKHPATTSKNFWRRMQEIARAEFCEKCQGNTPTSGNQRPKCTRCKTRRP